MSQYLTNLLTEKRLKQVLQTFWGFLTIVTGLICLVASFREGLQAFLSGSSSSLLIFILFCSSLLKLTLTWQGGLKSTGICRGLLVSELASLNPLTTIAMFLLIRRNRPENDQGTSLQEKLSLALLLLISLLQILLYTK